MKKLLLIGLACAPVLVGAQQTRVIKTNPTGASTLEKFVRGSSQGTEQKTKAATPQGKNIVTPTRPTLNSPNKINYPFKLVGTTTYDLQTNASIGRRILAHTNGTVSATWTFSNLGSAWDDRGTAYAYYNGTSWSNAPTVRIEGGTGTTYRTGWPNIGELGTGEYVFAHSPATGGFRMSTNSTVGSNVWTVSGLVLDDNTTSRPIWGRVANSGNIIHVVSNYSDSSSDNPVTTIKAGVRDPMVYSRSLDGGQSWPIKNTLLPNYNSSLVFEGAGDSYAIDVRDSIVAIVMGGLGEHVLLWKSTNNGNSFTMSYPDSFPFAPYSNNKIVGTNARTNDGSVEVVIDNNGKVHVFWGLSAVTQRDLSKDSALFTPASIFLMHWDEYTNTSDTIAGLLDLNNNSTNDIQAATWQATVGSSGTFTSAARYGNTSLVTMPSAAVDANNNIYCVYSAPVEEQLSLDNENYRDIYIVYSKNNGSTWSNPQNVTNNINVEDVFGCISKRVDSHVHMIWQSDLNPGTELQNADPAATNDIYYAAIPVNDILNDQIGPGSGTGISKAGNNLFSIDQCYPNPASTATTVRVNMKQGSDINISLNDMLGQVIQSENMSGLSQGMHEFTFDLRGLAPGVYFYTIQAGSVKETRKLIVQ